MTCTATDAQMRKKKFRYFALHNLLLHHQSKGENIFTILVFHNTGRCSDQLHPAFSGLQAVLALRKKMPSKERFDLV